MKDNQDNNSSTKDPISTSAGYDKNVKIHNVYSDLLRSPNYFDNYLSIRNGIQIESLSECEESNSQRMTEIRLLIESKALDSRKIGTHLIPTLVTSSGLYNGNIYRIESLRDGKILIIVQFVGSFSVLDISDIKLINCHDKFKSNLAALGEIISQSGDNLSDKKIYNMSYASNINELSRKHKMIDNLKFNLDENKSVSFGGWTTSLTLESNSLKGLVDLQIMNSKSAIFIHFIKNDMVDTHTRLYHFLKKYSLNNKNLTVEVNSLREIDIFKYYNQFFLDKISQYSVIVINEKQWSRGELLELLSLYNNYPKIIITSRESLYSKSNNKTESVNSEDVGDRTINKEIEYNKASQNQGVISLSNFYDYFI